MGAAVMTGLHVTSWGKTHPGAKRGHNEDACVFRDDLQLWAVADGAGGHSAGDFASHSIAEALEAIPPFLSASEMLAEVRLRIKDTHEHLRRVAADRGENVTIASTIVVMLVRNGHYACLWAGDSRAYLLRDGRLRQITKDHSLVQEMVDAGVIRPEDAEGHPRANVITRAVGAPMDDDFQMEKTTDRIRSGDRFLLCSDGLCKTLSEHDIEALLGVGHAEEASEALIDAALKMNASDNVTAVTVEVG